MPRFAAFAPGTARIEPAERQDDDTDPELDADFVEDQTLITEADTGDGLDATDDQNGEARNGDDRTKKRRRRRGGRNRTLRASIEGSDARTQEDEASPDAEIDIDGEPSAESKGGVEVETPGPDDDAQERRRRRRRRGGRRNRRDRDGNEASLPGVSVDEAADAPFMLEDAGEAAGDIGALSVDPSVAIETPEAGDVPEAEPAPNRRRATRSTTGATRRKPADAKPASGAPSGDSDAAATPDAQIAKPRRSRKPAAIHPSAPSAEPVEAPVSESDPGAEQAIVSEPPVRIETVPEVESDPGSRRTGWWSRAKRAITG
jgi:ribonuclease E